MADDTAYATISDIELRTGLDISEEQEPRVQRMLDDATIFIKHEITDAGSDPSTIDSDILRIVTTDLVSSWFVSQDIPLGASSISETVGDVSSSVSFSTAAASQTETLFHLNGYQQRLLGITNSQIRTIRMVPDLRY